MRAVCNAEASAALLREGLCSNMLCVLDLLYPGNLYTRYQVQPTCMLHVVLFLRPSIGSSIPPPMIIILAYQLLAS